MGDKNWSWDGIELIWVVLGFLGAAMGVGRLPPMGRWQLLMALVSGVVFAALAPQWAAHIYMYWLPNWLNPTHTAIPAFMNNTVAFFFGVGGMFIIPGFINFWQEFGNNPWGLVTKILDLLDRLRPGSRPSAAPPKEPGDHAGDIK